MTGANTPRMADGRTWQTQATRTIAVIMTCHNRREMTLGCLEALRAQAVDRARLSLFVTDDGSTDGTARAIRTVWPDATVLPGTGSLYWAAGMALAEQAAVASEPDFLLWLNDDTEFMPNGLQALLALSDDMPGAIIVGATADPATGEPTYGGRLRIDYHPQRLRQLPISTVPQRADTFNGNVVLVPMTARRAVGPIDGAFPHAYADDDYGLRATAMGISVIQAPGTSATCRIDHELQPRGRGVRAWRSAQNPKGLPWRAQVRFLRRHGGRLWPLVFVGQQVKLLVGEKGDS